MSYEFSITAQAPIVATTGEKYTERLAVVDERYTITENIGFDSASFTLTGPISYLTAWFEHGLARDVVWLAPDSATVWRGYVSTMRLTLGERTRTKSIEAMQNRVVYTYTPLTTTSDPPVAEAQDTITVNDSDSQAAYGIKSVLLTGNETPTDAANADALAELRKRRLIQIGENVAVGRGKEPSLQIGLRGYAHMLNWVGYSAAGTGDQSSSTLVIDVLASDANGIADTAAVNIETCATQVPVSWDGKKGGWAVIQDAASRGYKSGSDSWPWTCAMYENQRVTFKQCEGVDFWGDPEPTNQHKVITYYADGHTFQEAGGRTLRDWQIRPDRLIYTSGVAHRPLYVTQVSYTPATGITFEGRDVQNPFHKDKRVVKPAELDVLRAFTFTKDRDVKLQTGRVLVLGDNTEVAASGLVPIGAVVFWPSTAGAIPDGWATFAAAQGRFLVGAGGSFGAGDTGGQESIDIRHRHTYSDTTSAPSTTVVCDTAGGVPHLPANGDHTHTTSGNTSYQLSSTQSVLPPFLCGTWIQRVS